MILALALAAVVVCCAVAAPKWADASRSMSQTYGAFKQLLTWSIVAIIVLYALVSRAF